MVMVLQSLVVACLAGLTEDRTHDLVSPRADLGTIGLRGTSWLHPPPPPAGQLRTGAPPWRHIDQSSARVDSATSHQEQEMCRAVGIKEARSFVRRTPAGKALHGRCPPWHRDCSSIR